MNNFTTRTIFLVPSFELDMKEQEKLDKFLAFLDRSGVGEALKHKSISESIKGGRPSYRKEDLLATVLYGFAFKHRYLRDLESACRYDLRYMYLMQQERPSYVVFGDFINTVIVPNLDFIFHSIMKEMIRTFDIDTSEVFIDGTKFEADANKYKFVWKPTKFHERLSEKVYNLLKSMNMERNVPVNEIISSKIIATKLSELSAVLEQYQDSDKKLLIKNKNLLCEYLEKSLEYEEKERICGPNRNSYYKTDHDATAMCLKEDYYSGLGSNMHAAYSTQIVVSKGIIVEYYVSQSRNDSIDFITTIEKIKKYYESYPKIVCADAGYGSYENYAFLDKNNIGNYVKYRSWTGNVSGKNPDLYYLNENQTIRCLNGNIGVITEIEGRHPKGAKNRFYKVKGCKKCDFKAYCKRYTKDKTKNYRIFEVNEKFYQYKQEAERNLLSIKGIELRVNRSCQVEGAYGVLKEDMEFVRLKRTSIQKVETEIMLMILGYNIRKLFRFFSGKAKFEYWSAPKNIEPEEFKKPSAKRLSNKANKKKKKNKNEEAKSSYKCKK